MQKRTHPCPRKDRTAAGSFRSSCSKTCWQRVHSLIVLFESLVGSCTDQRWLVLSARSLREHYHMKIKYMFHQRLIDVNGTYLLCCSSTLSMVECVVKEWNFRMVTFLWKRSLAGPVFAGHVLIFEMRLWWRLSLQTWKSTLSWQHHRSKQRSVPVVYVYSMLLGWSLIMSFWMYREPTEKPDSGQTNQIRGRTIILNLHTRVFDCVHKC